VLEVEQKSISGGWMSKWDFSDPTCAAIRPDRSRTFFCGEHKMGLHWACSGCRI